MKLTYIDNGFYRVPRSEARKLGVPRHGYERRVTIDGREYWLGRTRIYERGKLIEVFAVHAAA